MADMVVDLAVPATIPPTTPMTAPAITRNTDAEQDENPLGPATDVASPLGEVCPAGKAPPVSKDGPGNGRPAIGRDNDNANGPGTTSSVSASAAGDSPQDADKKACLQASGERPSSSAGMSEGLDEAASGGDRLNEGESIRCHPVNTLDTLKVLPPIESVFCSFCAVTGRRGHSESVAVRCTREA